MSKRSEFLVGVIVVALALVANSVYAISLAGLEHVNGSILVGDKIFDNFSVHSVDAVGTFVVNGLQIEVTPFVSGNREGLAFDGLIQANCQLTLPACHTNNDGESSYIDMFFSYDIRTTDGRPLYDMGMTFNGVALGTGSSAQIIETMNLGGMVTVTAPSILDDRELILNSGDFARVTTHITLIAGSDLDGFASVSHFTQDFSSPPVVPEVPEPGTWLLLITGIAGLAGYRYYRRQMR